MDNKFIIREARPEDVLSMHHIYHTTWLNTYPNEEFDITTEDIDFKYENRLRPEKIEERKNIIRQKKENQIMLIAESAGRIVGLCNAIREDDYNQLQAIYILPEYQNIGIGSALWREAIKKFNLKNKTIVHVASYNQKAINFYQKIGFISTEKIFSDEKYKMRNGAIIPELEMIIEADNIKL